MTLLPAVGDRFAARRLYACGVGSASGPSGVEETSPGPQVAATVRLLHRRHGWSVTATWAFVAFLLSYGVYLSGENQGSTSPSWWAGIVWATVAVLVIALVVVFVDTLLLKRRPSAVRAAALAAVKDHPGAAHHGLRAHARRFPPRHFFSFVCLWLVLVAVVIMGVLGVSGLPDGVAYLAGAGQKATFTGQDYVVTCGYKSGCVTQTQGVLSRPGSPDVTATYPGQVPVGQPIKVREPLWSFGLGAQLISGTRGAVIAIVLSLVLDFFAIFGIVMAVRLVRNWARHRREASPPVAAGTRGVARLAAVAEIGGGAGPVRDRVEDRGTAVARW